MGDSGVMEGHSKLPRKLARQDAYAMAIVFLTGNVCQKMPSKARCAKSDVCSISFHPVPSLRPWRFGNCLMHCRPVLSPWFYSQTREQTMCQNMRIWVPSGGSYSPAHPAKRISKPPELGKAAASCLSRGHQVCYHRRPLEWLYWSWKWCQHLNVCHIAWQTTVWKPLGLTPPKSTYTINSIYIYSVLKQQARKGHCLAEWASNQKGRLSTKTKTHRIRHGCCSSAIAQHYNALQHLDFLMFHRMSLSTTIWQHQ